MLYCNRTCITAFLIYKVGKAVCVLVKIMKKILCFLLCVISLFVFSGCSYDSSDVKVGEPEIKVNVKEPEVNVDTDNIKVNVK